MVKRPGDDSAATGRFSVYDPADNADGAGDGTIGEGDDWATPVDTVWTDQDQETLKFFAHLRAAGLVPGDAKDSTRPTNAYGGQIGIQGGALGISGHVIIFGAIEGSIAKILEARLDNNLPQSGHVQAELTSGSMDAATISSLTKYEDAERYNLAFRL